MRIIDVPAPVTLKPLDEKGKAEEKTFFDFLKDVIENSQNFGKGFKEVYRGSKLVGQFEVAKIAKPETLQLEDADYDALKAAIEQIAWFPKRAIEMVTFFRSFDNAQQVAAGSIKNS